MHNNSYQYFPHCSPELLPFTISIEESNTSRTDETIKLIKNRAHKIELNIRSRQTISKVDETSLQLIPSLVYYNDKSDVDAKGSSESPAIFECSKTKQGYQVKVKVSVLTSKHNNRQFGCKFILSQSGLVVGEALSGPYLIISKEIKQKPITRKTTTNKTETPQSYYPSTVPEPIVLEQQNENPQQIANTLLQQVLNAFSTSFNKVVEPEIQGLMEKCKKKGEEKVSKKRKRDYDEDEEPPKKKIREELTVKKEENPEEIFQNFVAKTNSKTSFERKALFAMLAKTYPEVFKEMLESTKESKQSESESIASQSSNHFLAQDSIESFLQDMALTGDVNEWMNEMIIK